MNEKKPFCPSGRCQSGSILLGIMGPEGTLIYTPRSDIIDTDLAEKFDTAGGSARYRFAEPCVSQNCSNWVNNLCQIGKAAASKNAGPEPQPLPQCGIRYSCRWFLQEGRLSCYSCPEVLREDPLLTS